jgi:DNA recombination protein RmuC
MDLTLILILLALANLALLGWIATRRQEQPVVDLSPLQESSSRAERLLREEFSAFRQESQNIARGQREEVQLSVRAFNDSFMQQFSAFSGMVDGKLRLLTEETSKRLEEMRSTVDEKLQGTLERRLGESFRQVSERLEQVHRGLGEMQHIATGVGDLKKVLSNIKTRGTWGEVQLGALLEQILTPDQYAANISTRPRSTERVEFAIKLPGRDSDSHEPVWLPIDAKFPLDAYQKLVAAQESGAANMIDLATREFDGRVQGFARDIRDKYLSPPHTTDFGIMFLPTESLYAEVLRRPGLFDLIQRECRVVMAGPTTLTAILSSLQMGFRTLAIQKRSSEVWKLLGAVKHEFGLYGKILESVQKKLQEAANKIDDAASKTRRIESRLRRVEDLPEGEARSLLGITDDGGDLSSEDNTSNT